MPDLVLTSSLISPRDDAALAAHLRELGAAAAHVQTVTIPLLGSSAPQRAKGVLAALRREKPQPAMTDGCAPDVFAEQIRQYLATAEEQKVAAATMAQVHAMAPASPGPIETDAYLYEAGRQTGLEASMEPALVEAAGISVAPPAAIAEPFAEFEEPVPSHEPPRQAFEAWPAPEAPAIASETYNAETVDDDALVESSAFPEPIFVEPAPSRSRSRKSSRSPSRRPSTTSLWRRRWRSSPTCSWPMNRPACRCRSCCSSSPMRSRGPRGRVRPGRSIGTGSRGPGRPRRACRGAVVRRARHRR